VIEDRDAKFNGTQHCQHLNLRKFDFGNDTQYTWEGTASVELIGRAAWICQFVTGNF
jgi:hypothetical protein